MEVRSRVGKGSVFAIDVDCAPDAPLPLGEYRHDLDDGARRVGTILIVEDDPDVSSLLKFHLVNVGHRAVTAPDGGAALELVAGGALQPDLVLADYNLPNGLSGLDVAAKLRGMYRHPIPVIILTGDITIRTLRDIAQQNCVHLGKPVRLQELTQTIQRLLPGSPVPADAHAPPVTEREGGAAPVIFVVDDDANVLAALRAALEADDRSVEVFTTCAAFLEAFRPGGDACLLIDAYLPGMSGFDLLEVLRERGYRLPAIMITGNSDVPTAVRAMKAGAVDFIEKPINRDNLLASIERALAQSRDATELTAWRETAALHVAGLSIREHQIMDLVLAGHPSKNIAADLGISQRTVENHRAAIMRKTGTKSLPALARLALAAAWRSANEVAA